MNDPVTTDQVENTVNEISAAAQRAGIELDAHEAREWIVAMTVAERESAFAQDARTGIFGHRISMLDFDQDELDYFRRLARKARTVPHPSLESAIAIAGSAAQGRVQLFPGDTDFYERVNVRAPNREEATRILREVLRATAIRAFAEPDIVLVEVRFGVYSTEVVQRGKPRAAGRSIEWTPNDVLAGFKSVQDTKGQPLTINWDETQMGDGIIYFGWIVADRTVGRIGLASNVIDATWEAPDGKIIALDGAIDPFFQEIYLEPNEVPIFTKIVGQADRNALKVYIKLMREQVFHYTREQVNFGKAAKRLYNLFRLTDQLEAAAYLRELFDEPGARLYQVPGLLEAADYARDVKSGIERATVVQQIDRVIRAVIESGVGGSEADLIMELIRLRDNVKERDQPDKQWHEVLDDVTEKCLALINAYFRARLFALPEIETFVKGLDA